MTTADGLDEPTAGLGALFSEPTHPATESAPVVDDGGAEPQAPQRPKRPLRLGTPTRTRAVPAGVSDEQQAEISHAPRAELAPDRQVAESGRSNEHADGANLAPAGGAPVVPVGPSMADMFASPSAGQEPTDTTPGDFRRYGVRSEPVAEVTFPPNPAYAPVPQDALQQSRGMVSSRRYEHADRYWPLVDRVMSVAGSDVDVQRVTARLQLISDSEEDRLQRDHLLDILKPKLAAAGILIPDPKDIPIVLDMAYDEMVGISVLGSLWRDPGITEIMVDRWDKVTLERDGRLEDTPIRFRDPDHANSVARSLALRLSDRAVSRSINLVTAELPSARVQFAYGPVVRGGLSITIRKFRKLLGLDDLLRYRAISEEMIAFLQDAVTSRAGILISGGTGTGKTTIINLLSNFIPPHERVITIEDAFELRLANSHVVSLQTKEAASADDAVNVTLADLLRATLRMRPDRIIVGEIREGEGASVMLSAANTGHEGTMTTIHANSADLALNERLVDLVRQTRSSSDEAIVRTIASAFDLVIQVSRGRKGNRYISEIALVGRAGVVDGRLHPQPLFIGEDDEHGGARFRRVGSIGPDTDLARKLADEGNQPSPWIAQEG